MSKISKSAFSAGVCAALALATSASAGPNPAINPPGGPVLANPNLPVLITNCHQGFNQTSSWGQPNYSHSFTCTVQIVCPRPPPSTNVNGIGVSANRTSQLTGTLQYTCSYQIIQ